MTVPLGVLPFGSGGIGRACAGMSGSVMPITKSTTRSPGGRLDLEEER
jgi:hypothetical protein